MTRMLRALLVLSLPVVSPSTQIRGVAFSDQVKYASADFSCVVRGKPTNLPRHRVNDEYCDCDDGDDEPGTAACSHVINSVFHCENDGLFTGKIHTSRIHDGVCDCCDGSDEEIDGKLLCPNTCAAAAEKVGREAEQRLEVVKSGFEKRQVMVHGEVATYFDGVNESMVTIETEAAALRLVKDRVTVHKDREELRETKYWLKVARQKQVETHDGNAKEETTRRGFSNAAEEEVTEVLEFETLDAIEMADDDILVHSADDKRALEILDSNRQIVKSLIELPDGSRISLADYLRMNHNKQAHTKRRIPHSAEKSWLGYFLGREGRKKIGLHALRVIGVVISPVRALFEVLLYCPRTLWSMLSKPEIAGPVIDKLPNFPSPSRSLWFRRLGEGSVYDGYSLVMWGAQVVWDAPVYAYHYVFPKLNDEVKLPLAESLRTVLREIESDIAKLEKDRNEKREATKMDYGPDRAYFALKNKCIEKRIEKYRYKFCAFGEVKQDQTILGKWDYWYSGEDNDSSGKVDYTRMRYSKGQKCYNGPERSVLVHLECGEHDEILSVDEPSTCVYEMAVRSPLACTAQVFTKAREDMAFWTQKQLQ